MELTTTNPDIKLCHCYLKFEVQSQDASDIVSEFNERMREQLSKRGSQTPGKIMHTKLFGRQIRCYFAYQPTPSQGQFDWQQFVDQIIAEPVECKLIKLQGA